MLKCEYKPMQLGVIKPQSQNEILPFPCIIVLVTGQHTFHFHSIQLHLAVSLKNLKHMM